ncbi:BTB/POZ domain-containing protein [Rhizophagus clarus]|uniref:BTB/POZ domain-containing protein n=1 Tax=Rhizophagus clarus TaxID=94130 RepID=A0A8H3QJ44_9GLOM|nr:BTB/POZ domain-containing protein [Rhizophagus clarus]
MTYNYELDLSEAFGQLLKAETDYNVIIYIGKEPNFKEFHAHSNHLILFLRYLYTSKIDIANNIETELLNLMIVSDELMLKKLNKLIKDHIENQ